MPRNVAAVVKRPKTERKPVCFLTTDRAKTFLKAIRGDRSEALFSVAIGCGLRRGEALGLRWNDVDLDAGTLTIRHQLQRSGGKLHLTEPKTNQSRRTLHLPNFAVEALRVHKQRQDDDRANLEDEWIETGYVFTSQKGTALEPRNIARRLRAILKAAELPRMRFHDLRHTCASLLLAQNANPRLVMEVLGHSQIALTMNTYSHVLPALQRDAAQMLDDLLAEGS